MMTSEPAALGGLRSAVTAAEAAAKPLGRGIRLGTVPGFNVLVLGPVDAGKTALIRALLDDAIPTVKGIQERPGRDTQVPVEFRHSQSTSVSLGIGGDLRHQRRWLVADPRDSQILRTAGLRRARVALPAQVLRDWEISIVDTPGVENPTELRDGLLDEAHRPDTGVVYVVPSRGITEEDAQTLEMLRGVPVVIVENIRDVELIASRSTADEPMLFGPDHITMPIAVRRLVSRGRERELLGRCIALLRTRRLSRKLPTMIELAADRAQSALRTDYERRFQDALSQLRAPNPADRLRAVAALLSVERAGPDHNRLDEALTRVSHVVRALPAAEQLHRTLTSDTRDVVDHYNVEAASNAVDPTPSEEARGGPQFGRDYADLRNKLLKVIDRILDTDPLQLTDGDRRALGEARAAIHADRLELALLGQFSSGKSSLINALMEVPPTEAFLPAKPRPTTATVNRIVHHPTPSIKAVWLDEIELRLLSPGAEENQLRASTDEIRALGEWLRSGAVSIKDCEFRSVDTGRVTPERQLAAFWELWDLLAMDSPQPHRFVYVPPSRTIPRLGDPAVPLVARVRRFAHHPQGWADGLDLREAFDAISQSPALALQIDEAIIGWPHPLLKHVSIIDTPGTDAPIPHHRVVAWRAVADKPHCAVIYCFSGTKPAAAADEKNLNFLRENNIGKTALSRFFFTVTAKGLVAAENQPEVRDIVRRFLAKAGIKAERLYFTEVMYQRNDEFEQLSRDLNQFVAARKGPLLQSWIAHLQQIVIDVRDRHQRRLDDITQGEQSRLSRLASLKADQEALADLLRQLRTSSDWGEPWLRQRVTRGLDPEIRELDGFLSGVTSRAQVVNRGTELVDAIDDLNEIARRAVHGGCQAIADKLRMELSSRLPHWSVNPLPATTGDEIFAKADVFQTVTGLTWRDNWTRFKGFFTIGANHTAWKDDVRVNRSKIESAWNKARDQGKAAAEAAVTRRVNDLRTELARLESGIAKEIDTAARPPSKDDERAATDGREQARILLVRLASFYRLIAQRNSGKDQD